MTDGERFPTHGREAMTQENKFALIIGFALLLVVGILMSDHLAEVSRGEPGHVAVADPLASMRHGNVIFTPLLINTNPGLDLDTPLPAAAGMPVPMHEVQAGETLGGIAHKHYGDRTLALALAKHNDLPNPDRLHTGLRLIIPDQEHLLKAAEPDRLELRPATPALKSTTPTTVEVAAPPSMREYTVRSGDTLSELAQKLMGSARNTSQLLKINKDRIESADALRVGTRLRYPMAMATGTP